MEIMSKIGPIAQKNKRKIIVFWFIFLIVSIPLMLNVRDNTESSDVFYLSNSESEFTDTYIEDNFEEINTDQLLFVIAAEDPATNILDEEALQSLLNSYSEEISSPDAISVSSIYSIEEMIVNEYTEYVDELINITLDELMRTMLENSTSQIEELKNTTEMLFNTIGLLKSSTQELYTQMNFIKELNEGLKAVSGLYFMSYWNNSRIIYYLDKTTDAYNTTLYPDDYTTLRTWLYDSSHVATTLIDGIFYVTNTTIIPADERLGELIVDDMNITGRQFLTPSSYDLTNQTLTLMIGPQYTGTLLEAFLPVYNQTFDSLVGVTGLSTILDYTHEGIVEAQTSQGVSLNNLVNIHNQAFNLSKSSMFTIFNESQAYNEALLFQLLQDKSANLSLSEQEDIIRSLIAVGNISQEEAQLFEPLIPLILNGYDNATLETVILNIIKQIVNDSRLDPLSTGLYGLETYSNEIIKPFLLDLFQNELNSSIDAITDSFEIPDYFMGEIPLVNSIVNISEVISDLYDSSSDSNSLIDETIADIKLSFTGEIYRIAPPPTLDSETFPKEFKNRYVSKDNQTMLLIFESTVPWTEDLISDIKFDVDDLLEPLTDDYNWYLTGKSFMLFEMQELINQDVEKIDIFTIFLVLVLLTLVFLSVLAPTVPILAIGMSLITSYSFLWIFSQTTSVPTLMISVMTVVAFGAGVDYIIFILNRYKEERINQRNIPDAVNLAVHHSGESVLSSGMTVMVGFGSLMLSSFSFLQFMGLGPFISIACALLAALTLIPVLLSSLGDRIFWPRKFTTKKANDDEKIVHHEPKTRKNHKFIPDLNRIGQITVRHPKKVIIILIVLSTPLLYKATQVQPNYDIKYNIPTGAESSVGYEVIATHFTEGRVNPIRILLTYENAIDNGSHYTSENLDSVEAIATTINSLSYVAMVETVTRPLGKTIYYSTPLDPLNASLMSMYVSSNNQSVLLNVIFSINPMSNEGLSHIDEIRDLVKDEITSYWEIKTSMIGGYAASYKELADTLESEQPIIIIFVLIGIFLILLVLLKSVFTPLRLELTILFSVVVTLGATKFVFVDLLGEAVPWVTPIMLFVILFGLGMDYDIFLVSRMKEEVKKGKNDEEAIIIALDKTGKIIMTCGIIMASALGTLMISTNLTLQVMGFSFFFAILLDAFIIRLFLVPAIMMVAGKWNWWFPFSKNNNS